jgi:hypothetical protein
MATGSAATAAIWSLCVSYGDPVTHVLDIENLGDQIGRLRRVSLVSRTERDRTAPTSRQ